MFGSYVYVNIYTDIYLYLYLYLHKYIYIYGLNFVSEIILLLGFYCMICEPLGQSLYDYVKKNDYLGFPTDYVRDVMRFVYSIWIRNLFFM